MKQQWLSRLNKQPSDEAGQSIVLLAFMMVGLLAFAGLATDVGFLYMRTAQFDAAVDAAALAGVTEMNGNGTAQSEARALQFLNVNGWDVTNNGVQSEEDLGELGIPQFALTVTLPVDTFFMRILGFETISVTRSATAAYFAQADINTPTGYNMSQINMGSQFLFGENSCTQMGDPVIPLNSTPGTPNENYDRFEGKYTYRIRIRPGYVTETNALIGSAPVRIELFDPDSVNLQVGNTGAYNHSNQFVAAGNPVSGTSACAGWAYDGAIMTQGTMDSCVSPTGEPTGSPLYNPFWFVRVDEYWTGACRAAVPNNGAAKTVTSYELYYYDAAGRRQPVARYIADNSQAAATDLKWVSPGFDPGVSGAGSFTVADVTPFPIDAFGMRYLYLDVSAFGGTTKNTWDLWARPPDIIWTTLGQVPPLSDVNQRNLQIANNPVLYTTDWGLNVFAIARMPIDPYIQIGEEWTLPLVPIYTEQAGGVMYVSAFDLDEANSFLSDPTRGARPDLTFKFDSVGAADFRMQFGGKNPGNPPGEPPSAAIGCWVFPYANQCNNEWINPQMAMGIPDKSDGVAFYGGNLVAQYAPGGDEHTWQITVTSGRPFLTR